MVVDGASPTRAWTPSANHRANPSQHKLRASARAASSQRVEPGPQDYELGSAFDAAHLRGPPGFSRSTTAQRHEPRIKVHPLGRTLGPGAYDITGFGSFERYQSHRQQPWRSDRPTSRVSTSYVAGRPWTTRARDTVEPDAERLGNPGPGAYEMGRYSGFVINSYNSYGKSTRPATSSFGTSGRSDITSTYGDTRCAITCPAPATPGGAEYSTVPRLDRITLTSAGGAFGVGQLEPLSRGRTPFLRSSESLRSTLNVMAMHSPGKPRPADLTRRYVFTA